MKRTISTIMIVMCLTSVLNAQKTAKTFEQELITSEKKRSEAIARHDMGFLDKLYADDFRGVTAIGFELLKKT